MMREPEFVQMLTSFTHKLESTGANVSSALLAEFQRVQRVENKYNNVMSSLLESSDEAAHAMLDEMRRGVRQKPPEESFAVGRDEICTPCPHRIDPAMCSNSIDAPCTFADRMKNDADFNLVRPEVIDALKDKMPHGCRFKHVVLKGGCKCAGR